MCAFVLFNFNLNFSFRKTILSFLLLFSFVQPIKSIYASDSSDSTGFIEKLKSVEVSESDKSLLSYAGWYGAYYLPYLVTGAASGCESYYIFMHSLKSMVDEFNREDSKHKYANFSIYGTQALVHGFYLAGIMDNELILQAYKLAGPVLFGKLLLYLDSYVESINN